jgi:hypothetical protein
MVRVRDRLVEAESTDDDIRPPRPATVDLTAEEGWRVLNNVKNGSIVQLPSKGQPLLVKTALYANPEDKEKSGRIYISLINGETVILVDKTTRGRVMRLTYTEDHWS